MQASSPTFLLKEISVLLPFLVPANWFDMYAAQDQFEAEEISYKILELNTYSQALAIYYTLQADNQILAIDQQEADDFNKIVAIDQQLQTAGVLGLIRRSFSSKPGLSGKVPPRKASGKAGTADRLPHGKCWVTRSRSTRRSHSITTMCRLLNTNPPPLMRGSSGRERSPELVQIKDLVSALKTKNGPRFRFPGCRVSECADGRLRPEYR